MSGVQQALQTLVQGLLAGPVGAPALAVHHLMPECDAGLITAKVAEWVYPLQRCHLICT